MYHAPIPRVRCIKYISIVIRIVNKKYVIVSVSIYARPLWSILLTVFSEHQKPPAVPLIELWSPGSIKRVTDIDFKHIE